MRGSCLHPAPAPKKSTRTRLRDVAKELRELGEILMANDSRLADDLYLAADEALRIGQHLAKTRLERGAARGRNRRRA